jgi:alginate O-acetyltransferase complex protein AlgI
MWAVGFTLQIYFDFSGYSDMAIGIGRMIGFKFPENFNSPYVSQSITEFWRRWHITLGRWMRDYLYIPLGGNRVNTKFRLYFNLWFVFLVSGLWHGANWTFVIWGAYHGLFLILDRLFLVRLLEKTSKVLRIILTFFIASLGWVLFRSETLKYALSFYKKLFEFKFSGIGYVDPEVITIMIVAAIFAFFVSVKPGEKIMEKVFFDNYTLKRHLVMSTIVFLLFVISLASIVSSGFNPFIYFRF